MKMNHKGQAGKGTGAKTRKAITAKVRGGSTLKQIGKKVNRSGGTISAIRKGTIKNPPASLSTAINKSKPAKRKMTKR